MKKAADKATNYADNFVHTISHKNDIMEAFFDGYSEAMEDMLKDAVEGEVYLYYSYKRKSTAILVDIPKENLGDKVRIIVVKDESK